MVSSLTGIIRKFLELKESEKDFVLATIVETIGSTYRKAGARLLITRNGKFYGLLGGGCFEADLLDHALRIFDTQQTTMLEYDMRGPEDLVWGLGLGCNGAVKIRLEYLSAANDYQPLSLINEALQLQQSCYIASICNSTHPDIEDGQHFLITPSTTTDVNQDIPAPLLDAAGDPARGNRSELVVTDCEDYRIETFMARVEPVTRLLVIGGGPDSVPVIEAAVLLGWNISVLDYRDGYTRPENFPENTTVIRATPEQLPELINPNSYDAVVLMTHKFEYDARYLQHFVDTNIPYVGCLGPVARKDELLNSLDHASLEFCARVRGPVGLDLGGELPEEIALSLIAEIQATLNGRDGSSLSLLTSPAAADEDPFLSIIVLAAGGSTRFGALKQLLEYRGKSLLKRTVETALTLGAGEVIVVHGPKATRCERELGNYDVRHVVNDEWERGMSGSLRRALAAVHANSDGALVLLCDQPLVEPAQLQDLVSQWWHQPGDIFASEYGGALGVPAIIPRRLWEDLGRISGDQGARRLLEQFHEQVISFPLPEAEFDIDTQEDFARLLVSPGD